MATEFRLPDLGEGIEEADVVRILVSEGETIAVDQPVLEIETEKATVEVPSSVAGTVASLLVKEGDTVTPGQGLLIVEEAPASEPAPPPAAPRGAPAATPQPIATPPPAAQVPAAPPAAPTAPATPAAPEAPVQRTATSEEASPAPAPPSPAPAPTPSGETPVFAAPSVRRFAREIGVNVRDAPGSGPSGRISIDDVKRFARSRGPAPAAGPAATPAAPLPDFAAYGETRREPLSRLRRTVARNMAQSWAQVPHVTLHHTADITDLEAFRQQYKDRARAAGGSLTITSILLKIAAAALRAHPRVNASLDLERNELVVKAYHHIGVAVDTERGLVVPVVRNVGEKNIVELAVALTRLSERARAGELTLDDMRGASFTLTNLGGLGTGFFTPIINHPEAAVLGVGRAELTPVYSGTELQPRLRLPLSLSFDHRVIDGADGARFMAWIVDAIAEPWMLALEG